MVLWLSFAAACLGFAMYDPSFFSAQNISALMDRSGVYFIAAFIFISVLRAFTMLPSTPLVVAGTLLFPTEPLVVIFISMLGIMISAIIIYYFSKWMGFDELIKRKLKHRFYKIRDQINSPGGFLFVVLWASFPLVPTDVVCYAAGTVKMHVGKFILGIFLGEVVVVTLYVLAAMNVADFIF